jgi:phage/plasmid-like protein (TIGR03299 family)
MHMIDQTTGRAAIAYRNETPWHGLGQQVPEGTSIEDWARLGGIDYDVKRAAVMFMPQDYDHDRITMPERHVLYRSDTWKPLSVVGQGYKIVQPKQILETFRDLIDISGFEMDTVGALSDGKRVWALAKVGKAASIIGNDRVQRFLLVATSYDSTMSTIAKFVDERVVCHNTITAALGEGGKQIKVHHGKDFDADAVKKQLGIGVATWDKYVFDMKQLAQREFKREEAELHTMALLPAQTETFDPLRNQGIQAKKGQIGKQ